MILPNNHAFTQPYGRIADVLTIKVKVAESGQQDPTKFIETYAIWDTGAQASCISESLAVELGLVPSGKKDIKGVKGGIQQCDVFRINIGLPNHVTFGNITAASCDDLSSDGKCRILIGMDIISQGDMAVSNINGETVLTFRVPSVQRTDYVKDAKISAVKEAHFNKGKSGRRR